jgi:hypothetical protein
MPQKPYEVCSCPAGRICQLSTICLIEPMLNLHQKVRVIVQVPIHEGNAQDKALNKFLHSDFIGKNCPNFEHYLLQDSQCIAI